VNELGNIIPAMPNEEGSPEERMSWAAFYGICIGLLLGWWASRMDI